MSSILPGDRQAGDIRKLISNGLSLLQVGRTADLLRLIAQAFPAGPADPRLLVQKAYAHADRGEIASALADARLAMQAPLSELWALDLLGNVFTRCHSPDQAYAAFKRAENVAPSNPDISFNLATAAGFLGHAEEAERAYDRTIAAAPDNAEAYLNRALLRRQTAGRNHVPQLEMALRREPLPWLSEVHLRYALGKELDDLGDLDAAYSSLAHGAALRRSHMRYQVSEDIEAMAAIAAVQDTIWCAPASEYERRDGPIFIIGMPRSGSTLLERMIGRHSEVQAMGELPFFGQALVGAFRDRMGRMPTSKTELIDASAALDPAVIGRSYLAAVAPLRDARPRFIDKLPINFLYAGLIARALPGATLLHIRRRPLDLCFAIFKTLFRDGYPFSYDLAELGAYHNAYRVLMEHWRAQLGDRMVEIDYEALATTPGPVFAALLPKLGLDFQDACLSPEKDGTAVMTASAAQVRLPIHANSVGSAAAFDRHLGALRLALGE